MSLEEQLSGVTRTRELSAARHCEIAHEIAVAMHVLERQLNRRLWASDPSPIDGREGWDGNGSPCI